MNRVCCQDLKSFRTILGADDSSGLPGQPRAHAFAQERLVLHEKHRGFLQLHPAPAFLAKGRINEKRVWPWSSLYSRLPPLSSATAFCRLRARTVPILPP